MVGPDNYQMHKEQRTVRAYKINLNEISNTYIINYKNKSISLYYLKYTSLYIYNLLKVESKYSLLKLGSIRIYIQGKQVNEVIY